VLKEKDSWTTEEVQELIKSEFGISHSSCQVRRILKSLGMKYAKSARETTESQAMLKRL